MAFGSRTGKVPVKATSMPAKLTRPHKVRDAQVRGPRIKPLNTRNYAKSDVQDELPPSPFGPSPFSDGG